MLSFLINTGMKTSLLEWYENRLAEANLGMNSKIKKKYQGKTVEDEVEKLGTYVDLSNKNQQEIIAALIEQAKVMYGSSENIKLSKSWNQTHTTANMSISFKPYVDRMNIAFSPRLYITVRENTYTEVSLDFRIDTSGSGSFNSRLITIVTGFAEKMSEEIINSMFNVKKLNALDGEQYPPEWSKKQYTIFVAGFDTSEYVPPKVASPEFTSKTIDEWIMLPRYWNGNFFNYDKALEDMFGQDIEYEVCKFRKLTPRLEQYVKYKRRYREELEGNIVKAMVIIDGKMTKEIVHDLSLRLFVYKDPSYKEFFINVHSYYMLEVCGGITIPEEDPKLEELVSKVEVNSDMFTEVKNKIAHYISSNKNSTIVKNAKKRILSILDKKNKELKESNLGLNSKVKKKFNDVDSVENVSQIPFDDPEVEKICHEHGVYTVDDARDVTNIKGWFTVNKKIKTFNELKFFTGLKTIEEHAFECCSSLQSINIPDSVNSIDEYAFECCDALQSINIPNSVTNIGGWAFKECESLQSVIIPDSVTSIGRVAFYYCNALQSINIPDGVTIIGYCAFDGCESLQSIYISKDSPVYSQIKKAYPNIQLIEPKVNESSNLGLNSKVKRKFGVETLEDTAEEIAHDFSTVKSTMSAILTETIKRAPDNWWCWHGCNMKIIQLITPIFDGRIHRGSPGIMEIIPYGDLDKDRLTLQIQVNDEDVSYQLKDNDIGANKNAFDNCMSILFNFTEYVMDEEANVEDTLEFDKFIRKNEDQLALMTDINKRTVIVDLLDSFGLLD